MISTKHFNSICRFCFKRENLQNIFSPPCKVDESNNCQNETRSDNISFKLYACYNLEMSPEDSLPKKICINCISSLNASYEFKILCEKSVKKLMHIVNCNKKYDVNLIEEINRQNDDFSKKKYGASKTENSSFTVKYDTTEIICNGSGKEYKCYACDKTYASLKLCQRHSVSAHNTKERTFQCYFCHKMFRRRGNRLAHERDHCSNASLERLYTCRECSEVYSNRKDFDAHIGRHSVSAIAVVDGPQICSDCGHVLANLKILQQHRKLHEGRKNYVCHVCGWSFARGDYLATHIKSHTGNKVHRCHMCQYSTVQRSALVAHIQRHAGVTKAKKTLPPKIKCLQCDRMFRTRPAAQKHLLVKHEGLRPHACLLCNKHYCHARGLRRHLKLNHPDTGPLLAVALN